MRVRFPLGARAIEYPDFDRDDESSIPSGCTESNSASLRRRLDEVIEFDSTPKGIYFYS
jgi:hypothetical protein